MSDININIKVPAVEKLIDVFASGIGSVTGHLLLPYKAWMQAKADKVEAKGKAEAMKITAKGTAESTKLIAQAQFKVKDMLLQGQGSVSTLQKTNIEMDTAKLIQTKVQFQEEKRLNNIRNILIQAKNKLPKQVSNEPVDPDWTARFFQSAQDISVEEMQQIWSSILAGEVETPGRTSLRTLDILKNMTKKEAEIFDKVMKYKIDNFIFHDYLYGENVKKYINYDDLLILEEMNLLNASSLISSDFSLLENEKTVIGDQWGYTFQVYSQLNSSKRTICIPGFVLRRPALELSSFLHHTPNFSYLKVLARYLKEKESCCLAIRKPLKKEGSKVMKESDSLQVIQP